MFHLILFCILSFFAASLYAVGTGETCDRGVVDQYTPKSSSHQKLCKESPRYLVAALKAQIAQYLCLYHSDLECLKRVQTFGAKYGVASTIHGETYAQDFERMVGDRYINTWLHGSPTASFAHPMLIEFKQSGSVDLAAGSIITDLITNFIPGAAGKLMTAISSTNVEINPKFGSSLDQGTADNSGSCELARLNKINGIVNGRGCRADYNFNSAPVAEFLKQDANRQAHYLKCGDTCNYYTTLIGQLEITNEYILRNSLPIFDEKPKCLSGGRVSFSFSAQDYQAGAVASYPTLSWQGLKKKRSAPNRSVHYSFLPEESLQPKNPFLRWSVTGDMVTRNRVSADRKSVV